MAMKEKRIIVTCAMEITIIKFIYIYLQIKRYPEPVQKLGFTKVKRVSELNREKIFLTLELSLF